MMPVILLEFQTNSFFAQVTWLAYGILCEFLSAENVSCLYQWSDGTHMACAEGQAARISSVTGPQELWSSDVW